MADEELMRIDEEIRRAKEKRQKLEDRKNRRLRQIREREERERAAWLKKMMSALDKDLSQTEGKKYFYDFGPEQVVDAIHRGGIEKVPPEKKSGKKTEMRTETKEEPKV